MKSLEELIAVRRAELAVLENALDVIAASDRLSCPGHRGARVVPPSPCYGTVSVRHCFGCGAAIARCEEHGGTRALAFLMKTHASDCEPAALVADALAAGIVTGSGAETPKLLGVARRQPGHRTHAGSTSENGSKPSGGRR